MEMIGQNMKNLGARRCRGQIEPEPAPMTRLPTPKPIPPTNSSTAKSFEHIVNATKEEGVEDQNTVFSRLLEAAAKVHSCKCLHAHLSNLLEVLYFHLSAWCRQA
jgi:hypothetical protein